MSGTKYETKTFFNKPSREEQVSETPFRYLTGPSSAETRKPVFGNLKESISFNSQTVKEFQLDEG